MKNKKVIGLVLSFVLILGVALPGTLATSTDTTGSDSEFSIGTGTVETTEQDSATPLEDAENKDDESPVAEDGAAIDTPTCTCGTEDGVHTEGCELYVAPPVEPTCTCGTENGVHAEDCPLYEAPSDPVCTCGTQDGVHAEDCPLYEAPSDPVCTCGTQDGVHAEGCPLYEAPSDLVCTCGTQDGVHTEGCPLYEVPVEPVLPEEPAHIDTCVEGCIGENCECPCHELSLFERLMACKTLDEIDIVLEEATDEEFASLTDEENREIDAYIESLEPAPLPAVVIEESDDETVVSEIVYPTVSFTNVAPFGDPVIGGAN
jgi:hypothetical protein